MEKQQTTVPVRLVTASYVWSFLSSFLLFFAFYLLLPILPMYLIEQFQAGKSLIGIILSSYTITALLIRPFAGYLVDTFPRKIFLIVTYTLFTAFFAGYMIAATVFVFAMLRAMHGLAFGLVTISNSTVAIDIMPSQRRNEGIGYYALSTNIAMAVGPVVSLYLLDLFKGYDYIFLTSLISGMIGLFCVLMIKAPVHKKVKQEVISFDRFFLVKGLPCAIVFTLLAFSYGILTTYVAIYGVEEVGLTTGTGFFFAAMAGGMVLSRLLSAGLMKKGMLNESVLIGTLLMIVGYSVFIFLKSAPFFYLSAVLLGVAYGYVCPAFQAIFINLSRHNQRGAANSSYFISWDLGIGLGVLIGGQIADMSNYTVSYIAGLVLIVVGLVLYKTVIAGYYKRNRITA